MLKTPLQPIPQNDLPDQDRVPTPTSPRRFLHSFLPWIQLVTVLICWLLVALAFYTSLGLFLDDLAPRLLAHLAHAPISAAPLLLIGGASLCFLILTRPKPLDLCKALLVSLAFLLWGIDQLLPAGWITTFIGDLVIVLYVVDLGWTIASALRRRQVTHL